MSCAITAPETSEHARSPFPLAFSVALVAAKRVFIVVEIGGDTHWLPYPKAALRRSTAYAPLLNGPRALWDEKRVLLEDGWLVDEDVPPPASGRIFWTFQNGDLCVWGVR